MATIRRFDDPEAFRGSIAAASAELAVGGSGRFSGELTRLSLPGAHIQRARSNLPHVLLAGVTARAVMHIGSAEAGVTLNGRRLQAGEVALCPAGGEVHVRTEASTEWNTVSFSLKDFASANLRVGGRPLEPPRSGIHVVRPPAGAARLLVELRANLLARHDDRRACGALQAELVDAAAGCFANIDPAPERLSERRARQVVAAFEHFALADDMTPTLAQVSEMAGIPLRTLNTACRAVLGMSGARYLRQRRLMAVRRAILDGGTTVTAAATAQNFWELGQFAAAYRATFGERPSETLRRATR